MLWTARRVESEGPLIRGICAVWFVAACGRVLSIVTVGRPHAAFIALMVVEFAIPIAVVPWQTAVARRASQQ